MKLKALVLAATAALIGGASATVTLQFTVGTTNVANGFLGSAGQVSGLQWGILVDTAANGFLPGGPDGYGAGSVLTSGSALMGPTAVATDDVLWMGTTTLTNAVLGNGVITTLTGVSVAGAIDPGMPFALVWFDAVLKDNPLPVGTAYGLLPSASFIIPPDGYTQDLSGAPEFVGSVERLAGTDGRIIGIPEPSAALLSLIGLLGFIRRRR